MSNETIAILAMTFLSVGGLVLGLYVGSNSVEKNVVKLLLERAAEVLAEDPRAAKAYWNILPSIVGGKKGRELLDDKYEAIREVNKILTEQLESDAVSHFKAGNFEMSLKRAEELYEISDDSLELLSCRLMERADAMIRFNRAKWMLDNTFTPPIKCMLLLEEAKTLAGDYEIPGYAERKTEILAEINKLYGKEIKSE